MKVEDIKMVAVIDAGDMGHGIAEAALITGTLGSPLPVKS